MTAHEAGFAPSDAGAQLLFAEVAAACESGMDMTSRWLRDGVNLNTSATSLVVPVELNSLLYIAERHLEEAALTLALATELSCDGGGGGGEVDEAPHVVVPCAAEPPPALPLFCSAEGHERRGFCAGARYGDGVGEGVTSVASDDSDAPIASGEGLATHSRASWQEAAVEAAAALAAAEAEAATNAGAVAAAFAAEERGGALPLTSLSWLTWLTSRLPGWGGGALSRVALRAPPVPQPCPRPALPLARGLPLRSRAACAAGVVARDVAALRQEAATYGAAARTRAAAVEALLWDEGSAQWRDLRIEPRALPHAPMEGPPLPHAEMCAAARTAAAVAAEVATEGAAAPEPCMPTLEARFAARTDLQVSVGVGAGGEGEPGSFCGGLWGGSPSPPTAEV